MKKTLSVLLAAVLMLSVLPFTAGAADVIEISSQQQLAAIATQENGLSKSYKLTADITLSGTWTPLGSSSAAFTGTFDGGGKTIKGLNVSINSSSGNVYAGLFANVSSGTIKNLKVAGSVTATSTSNSGVSVYAGGIAGYCSYTSSVDNCTSTVTVNATLAPTAAAGTSSFLGSSPYNGYVYAGGIIGCSNSFFSVEECANKGSVTATVNITTASGKTANGYVQAGGIAGKVNTLINCYNTANVTGNCKSTNGTTTAVYSGGIAGTANTIKTSYNTGSIACTDGAPKYIGGVAGELATASSCYYLNSSASAGVGHPTNTETPATATALSSSGMYNQKMSGFDYESVWVSSTFSKPVLFDPSDVISGEVTVDGTLEYSKTLTANVTAITPAEAQGKLKYQWYNGVYSDDVSDYVYTAIENATAATYTLTANDIGKRIMVVVRGSYWKIFSQVSGYGGSVKSSGYGPVSKLTPAKPAVPVASAITNNSVTLATVSGCEYMMATSSTVWFSTSWSNGAWQDSPSFTGLSANTAYRFYQRVKGTATANQSAQSDYAEITTADASGNITISGTVAINGNAVFNETLIANTSSVTPTGVTFTYQWYRVGLFSDTAIAGATGSTYKLTAADVGSAIKVAVTANKAGYAGTLTSSATGTVTNVTISGTVAISGIAKIGNTLTANTNGVSPAGVGLTYRWYRGEEAISGATGNTYVLGIDDFNNTIKLTVTASQDGYTGSLTSASTSAVTASTLGGTVNVNGSASVGSVLTADISGVTPVNTAVTYQWYAGSASIADATSASYTVKTTDLGKKISVKITANQAGVEGTLTSRQTAAVAGAAISGTVTVNGTAKFGQTLTADVSGVSPSAISFTYQWRRNDVNISGATSSSYTLTAADVESQISVRVTANSTGYSGSLESAKTQAVEAIAITGTVTISGNAVCGSVLTAVTSAITPQIRYSYQWYRGEYAIRGASTSTYALTAADAGSTLKVVVTAAAAGYKGTLTSAPTASVEKKTAATPAAPTQKSVTDTAVTLNHTVGYEYKMQYYYEGILAIGAGWRDMGSVQSSNAFTGLTAETRYRFAQRIAETDDTKASGWSEYTEITTLETPAAPVNITGTVVITGECTVGKTLTVNTADVIPADVQFIYAWYSGGVQTGSAGNAYTLTAADIGKNITVSVTANTIGYTGTLTSEPTALVSKAPNTTVCPAPTLAAKTANNITLTASAGCEYAIYKNNGFVWQSSPVFSGLAAGTEYTFVMRYAETNTAFASVASAQVKFTTDAEYIRGDVDGDRNVTTTDARKALRVAAKLDPIFTGVSFEAADMDNDNTITTTDARRILRVAAKLSEV